MSETTTSTTKSGRTGGAQGFLRYWGPPVAIGLVLGVVFLYGWRFLTVSPVDRLVDQWRWAENEAIRGQNEALAADIRALGRSAGDDLLDAFAAASCEFSDHKLWIGGLLIDEPFQDLEGLAGLARNGDECDRRAASTLLALTLGRETDHDLVMPGILDWLHDLDSDYHDAPIEAVVAMFPLYGEWDGRAKQALVALAAKRPPRTDVPADEDWTARDRSDALRALVEWLRPVAAEPDAEVLALLTSVLNDETDDSGPRIEALRGLSGGKAELGGTESWIAALRSADSVVRQAAAEHLGGSVDPAFDEALAALHRDEHEIVRVASVDTQTKRRSPTVLPVIDELLEDWDEWVRYEALRSVSVFRAEPGAGSRNGMLIRLLATSTNKQDINGAILALFAITGKLPDGITESHLDRIMWEVDEGPLQAFMNDATARKNAVVLFREQFGGTAVWTTSDREKTLRKLLEHPDLKNQARAKDELEKLK